MRLLSNATATPLLGTPVSVIFDRAHGTMWGGSSNQGEDYGIGW